MPRLRFHRRRNDSRSHERTLVAFSGEVGSEPRSNRSELGGDPDHHLDFLKENSLYLIEGKSGMVLATRWGCPEQSHTRNPKPEKADDVTDGDWLHREPTMVTPPDLDLLNHHLDLIV